jgi:FlaA1/EpsC-like NDP-sugar epimerase
MTHSAERLILIGTAGTVPAMHAALRAMGAGGPIVLGALLADDGDLGVLDADPTITILGMIDDLPDVHRGIGPTAALVSLPASMSGATAKVRSILERTNLPARHMAPMTDVLAGVTPAAGAALDFAALIGRKPRTIDEAPVRRLLEGHRVLITGAGGSIGSELALRCAALGPQALFLMDRAENSLFEIDRRIKAQHPSLERKAILHDVVDADATLRRLVALRPDVVFHAAAHKHVPMMEDHPSAAVTNNLFGTKSIADAALATGVERFVMISTDKAVNPTSVMGATKRLAEVYVRSLGATATGQTQFRIVRFGNVLGSACSVLPVWGSQIAEGGPVTVTHPAMTRFFMTIPEAAALVVQAAAVDAQGSSRPDVFVLDMGEPVRIRDLAERFVRAHGLSPYWEDPHSLADTRPVDPTEPVVPNRIRCVFTGIRPGEKLHEELAYAAEELQPTVVPGVMAWAGGQVDRSAAMRMIGDLSAVKQSDDASLVLAAIQRHVPEMTRSKTIQNTPAEAA